MSIHLLSLVTPVKNNSDFHCQNQNTFLIFLEVIYCKTKKLREFGGHTFLQIFEK